jgi:hypothetical protein
VPNRVHQVGFAQAGVAVDEEGIVSLRGRLGDGAGGGLSHLVVVSDDEGLERIPRVERPGIGAAFLDAPIRAPRGVGPGGG